MKHPVYEKVEINGITCVQRNKYPRFRAQIVPEETTYVVRELYLIDTDVTESVLNSAKKKAIEYWRKGWRYEKGNNNC